MLTRLDVARVDGGNRHTADTLLLCDSAYIVVMADGRLTACSAHPPTNDKLCQ